MKANRTGDKVEVTTHTGEEIATFNEEEAQFVARQIVKALDDEAEEQQDGFSYPITTPPTELEAPELTAILIDYFKSNERKTVFNVMDDVFDLEVDSTADSDYQKVYKTLYHEDTFKARDVDGQAANEYSLAGSPFKYMENYVG